MAGPGGDPPARATPGAPSLVLVGPAGVGKSAVAVRLARRTGCDAVDTDVAVEAAAGASVPELFATGGEASFRALERTAVAAALRRRGAVVSLGGGAVLDAATRAELVALGGAGVPVVHLTMTWSSAERRLAGGQGRPLLAGDARAAWTALDRARAPLYAQVATVVVPTDGRWPRQVADTVLEVTRTSR